MGTTPLSVYLDTSSAGGAAAGGTCMAAGGVAGAAAGGVAGAAAEGIAGAGGIAEVSGTMGGASKNCRARENIK